MEGELAANILKKLGKGNFDLNLLLEGKPAIRLQVEGDNLYINIVDLATLAKIFKELGGPLNLLTLPQKIIKYINYITTFRENFKIRFVTGSPTTRKI